MEKICTNKTCPQCGGQLKATDNMGSPFICSKCGEVYKEVDNNGMELCLIIPMFVALRNAAKVKLEEKLFDIQVDDNNIATISSIKMNTCELIQALRYSYLNIKYLDKA